MKDIISCSILCFTLGEIRNIKEEFKVNCLGHSKWPLQGNGMAAISKITDIWSSRDYPEYGLGKSLKMPQISARAEVNIYGFNPTALNWMKTYLTGRTQRTKIGSKLSVMVSLSSGVPQGGNFSPLAFVIYVSDLEDWLQFAKALTYTL